MAAWSCHPPAGCSSRTIRITRSPRADGITITQLLVERCRGTELPTVGRTSRQNSWCARCENEAPGKADQRNDQTTNGQPELGRAEAKRVTCSNVRKAIGHGSPQVRCKPTPSCSHENSHGAAYGVALHRTPRGPNHRPSPSSKDL